MCNTKLNLHEEILLLALRDRQGTIESNSWFSFGIAGGILAELLVREKIEISTIKKQKVRMLNRESTSNQLLDECLERIESKRPRSPQAWIEGFSRIKDLKHRIALDLVEKKILRVDQDKVLLIFNRRIYPEADHKPEAEIIERLRKAIFSISTIDDTRTIVLLSLIYQTEILYANFSRKDIKPHKDRIESLINGEAVDGATKAVIDSISAATAALMVVITSAAITTTT
jgi:golgi phosphoprotein 3